MPHLADSEISLRAFNFLVAVGPWACLSTSLGLIPPLKGWAGVI